ncbi:MFS transporter [Vogesella oryzae]|uniref:MFS transporter n=1 Tax=Vogesella oryzae TaxID=1735285 RepID=UPI0015837847|nr:MFS transporter [Vogesella oryzae]
MSQQSVDVQAFIDRHPFSPFQWFIFALCFCIVLLDGFDTAAIGYVAPSLLKEWGIAKPALGPVLTAALFGLSAGALLTGSLSDRFGRKKVLVTSVAVLGVFTLASSFASNLTELSVLRFLTGLGLGTAMPNAVTLMSEYCPAARRSMLTNAMFCGFPLGASLGGFVAAWMIPQWGWRSVMLFGGVAPLLLLLLMLLVLPESVRYLVAHAKPHAQVVEVLARISAAARSIAAFHLSESKSGADGKRGLAVVFSPSYRVGSIMLWLTYFMGVVIFYAVINWMPTLFKEVGIDGKTAMLVSALFPLGGIGAVFSGWLMDRFNADRIIAIGFLLTALSIYAVGQVVGNVGTLMVVVFIAGTVMNTAQSSLPALAASFYPTQGRATGVSWMMGIGRFGGILGSLLVAELARRHVGFDQVFLVLAIPGVLAAAALLVKNRAHPEAVQKPVVASSLGH